MKRVILAFLLVGLITLLVPSLRVRVQPRIDAGRVWLGNKLEGPLSPVLTPWRTMRTETELSEITAELAVARNRGQDPPPPHQFRDYIIQREIADDANDPWGVPYILHQRPDSVDVMSAGPDLTYDTGDDIIATIRYRAPRRRGRR